MERFRFQTRICMTLFSDFLKQQTTTIMAKDRESLIKSFKKAANRVQSKPKELARVLLLPVVKSRGASNVSASANLGRQEQFVASDGTDWSEVLFSWLEARNAAEEVGRIRWIDSLCFAYVAFRV